mgnify:FL=1
MTFEEIKKWMDDNQGSDEVKGYLNSLITSDKVESFLESEEGKRLLQPRLDRYHAKSLDSWKENNLQKLIDEKVAELNPTETEEQRKIRELEERLNAAEREKTQQAMLNKVTQQLSKEGLPTDLANLLIAEDEEALTKNVELYKTVVGSVVERTRKEILKEHGRDTLKGGATADEAKSTIVDELINNKVEANDRAQAAAEKYGL